MSSAPLSSPSRPDGVPTRPDVTSPVPPPRTDQAHRGRRTDPTLVGVLAIFLAGAVATAAIAIAGPRPTPLSQPGAAGPGQPGIADVVPTGPDGPYAFLAATYVGGQREPVRWNPCQPIEYQIDVDHGPPETATAIEDAIGLASRASGIAFRFDGTTDRGIAAMRHGQYFADPVHSVYRPVLITVVTHAEFHRYDVPRRVLAFTHPERGTQTQDDEWVSGYVVVDGGIRYTNTGRWSMELVIAHELGHLLGLGHVRDPNQLMFSTQVAKGIIPAPIDGYGAGDLAGFELVGAGQGCLPHVRVDG